MIRRSVALAFALTALVPALFGQSADKEAPKVAPGIISDAAENPFLKGEQTISLTASLGIPLFIAPATAADDSSLGLGGAFSFSYQYFIDRGIALGGTIDGAFNGTVAGRSLFLLPLAFRGAYWTALMPFEFFGAAEAGLYIMRLDDKGMVGPFAKAGGGALWRSDSGWSLGLQAYYWLVPELHSAANASLNRFGNFLETGLVAVYHL